MLRKLRLIFLRTLEYLEIKIENGTRFARDKKWWIVGVVVWAAAAWFFVRPLPDCQCLRVIMFDIGQGDGFAVIMPDNKKMIVDFGPSDLIVSSWQRYFDPADKNINEAIFSHPDLDHLSGSLPLLRQYVFERVLGSWPKHEIAEVLVLEKYWSDFDFKPMQAVGPRNIFLGPDIFLELLWPQKNVRGFLTKNTNNESMVFRLRYKNSAILFTGDAEKLTEEMLLKQKVDLKSEVLKVSHHGSKTGTSLEFLKAVSPALALISVGANNKYGHPHLEVIKRLAGQNIKTYRTDQLGDVILRSDGKTWSVEDKPLWQAWQEWLIR